MITDDEKLVSMAAALSAAIIAAQRNGGNFISAAFKIAVELNKNSFQDISPDEFCSLTDGFSAKLVSELCGRSVFTINKYRTGNSIPVDVYAVAKTLSQIRETKIDYIFPLSTVPIREDRAKKR